MPVPKLIAAFLTEGYYTDHVGTLNFSSHTSTASNITLITTSLNNFSNGNSAATNTSALSTSSTVHHNGGDFALPYSQHQPPINSSTGRQQHYPRQQLVTGASGSPLSSSKEGGGGGGGSSHDEHYATQNVPLSVDDRRAAFVLVRALKDLSPEAQEAVDALPFCNPISFMHPATKEMNVSAIRSSLPKRYLPLYSSAVTPAPLDSYIHQILTLLRTEDEEVIIGLVLLAKVSTRIPICNLSVARMFLTAMVVASKLRADERISMRAYATFGGVEVSDMLAMERAFLTALGFDAGVRPEEYVDMVYSLRHYCVAAAMDGVQWIIDVWGDLAPRITVPDLRHLEPYASPSFPQQQQYHQ